MALEIDIEKNFKGFHFKVKLKNDGNRLGILGASGCGKSMLLKCISGIIKPDAGKIILNGKVLFDAKKGINIPTRERKVGYLFQSYALFPTMTVEENIGAGLLCGKKEKSDRIKEQILKFQLEGLEKRYPHQLSGGQQQRVAIARMLVNEPEIIMFDEPFSALDAYLKDHMMRKLAETLEDFKGDAVFVSHSRDEIYRFSQELAIMHDGNVIEFANTKKLFLHPGKMISARLTGCKNISKARKIDETHIEAIDWGMILAVAQPIGEKISYVGIRAKDLKVRYENQENIVRVAVTEKIETPMECQYLLVSAQKDKWTDQNLIWWRPGFKSQGPQYEKIDFIQFPKEKILLLSE